MTIPFMALIVLAVLFVIFAPKVGSKGWNVKQVAILVAVIVILIFIVAGGTVTEVIVK